VGALGESKSLSVSGFIDARQATERLLGELGLRNYLFDVEPLEDGWEIRLECQADSGWKTMRLRVSGHELEHSLHDGAARAQLLAAFRAQFGACTGASQ
jgi:hypothetical protein